MEDLTLQRCREALAMLADDADMCHWTDGHTAALRDAMAALREHTADAAALRKDAERYRWLRDHGDGRCSEKDGYGGQTLKMGECLDAAVDAAMAAAPAVGAA